MEKENFWNIHSDVIFVRKMRLSPARKWIWVTAHFPVLMLALSGEGQVFFKDNPTQPLPFEACEEHRVFLLPQGSVRYVKNANDQDMEIIAMGVQMLYGDKSSVCDYFTCHGNFTSDERAVVAEVMTYFWEQQDEHGAAVGLQKGRYLQCLAGILCRNATLQEARPHVSEDQRMEKALTYLRAHFREDVPIDTLCKICGMSRPSFFRLFKKEFGITVSQFIQEQRVVEAQRLLTTCQDSIGEIGRYCGWDDQFHFSRIFRKVTGISPSAFRKSMH